MVSSCSLTFDELFIIGQKASVPDFLSSLFTEADRCVLFNKEREEDDIFYSASRDAICIRLDLNGCTRAFAEHRFNEWRERKLNDLKTSSDRRGNDEDFWVKEYDLLLSFTWPQWLKRVPEVLRTKYHGERYDRHLDEIDKYMKEDDFIDSWLWFDGVESLVVIRALLEACTEVSSVSLNVGDLVHAGWLEKEAQVCERSNSIVKTMGQPINPTILLGEGKSDIAILKAAMPHFHPELEGYLTFLDHADFSVAGGTSPLIQILKSFAAAGIPSNFVALFDNDAAGVEALETVQALNLPPNIIAITMPEIDLARVYPTIGPQGEATMDINGEGCSIEIYLGQDALSKDSKLRPVEWGAPNKKMNLYQGVIIEKGDVQSAFLQAMKAPRINTDDYPEMKQLWKAIIRAATKVAQTAQSRARPPFVDW